MGQTVTMLDLFNACQSTYRRDGGNFDDAAMRLADRGFETIHSEATSKNHHGGCAFFNKTTGELIIAHRGSTLTENAVDWWKTNMQILMRKPFTGSALDAIHFSRQAVAMARQIGAVKRVYQTGHSKGGHEAQSCRAAHSDNNYCFTFNSAQVRFFASKKTAKPIEMACHINMRVRGLLVPDVVSGVGGAQLGNDMQISSGTLIAHKMASVKAALDKNALLAQANIAELCDPFGLERDLDLPFTPAGGIRQSFANPPQGKWATVCSSSAKPSVASPQMSLEQRFNKIMATAKQVLHSRLTAAPVLISSFRLATAIRSKFELRHYKMMQIGEEIDAWAGVRAKMASVNDGRVRAQPFCPVDPAPNIDIHPASG